MVNYFIPILLDDNKNGLFDYELTMVDRFLNFVRDRVFGRPVSVAHLVAIIDIIYRG